MFRIEAGRTGSYCDGLSRRHFLQVGVAGMASVGLSRVLEAKAGSFAAGGPAKDTSVILVWLDGGPSHIDMYDPKPDAPAEYRGLWSPIPTNVPGIEIGELLPLHAKVADKFSIIRSLHHDQGDHFTAGHYMLTSRGGVSGADNPGRYPGIGSIVGKVAGPRRVGMPAQVAVPVAMSIGLRPGYFGANYLGAEHNPFETEGDPNNDKFQVRNVAPAGGMTIDRLGDRRTLLTHLDKFRREVDASGTIDAMDRFDRQAYELVSSAQAAKAFDLSSEDAKLRERYGRHTWAQSTLLARRLVEAGCTFVTVHCGGWDHHWDLQKGYDNYLPKVDQMISALFEDLHNRGLLDKVLVMVCGEFGRTPKMNDGGNGGPAMSMGTPGRDHWGNAMSCLIGGGGVKGGRIVGSTNRLGEAPKDRPLTCGDLHATIYQVLGIDPKVTFADRSGRPIPAIDDGEPIRELF